MVLARKFASLIILVVDLIIWIMATKSPDLALWFFGLGFLINVVFLIWVFWLSRKAFSIWWLVIGPTLVFITGAFFYAFIGNLAARILITLITLGIVGFLVEESVRYVYWPQIYKNLSLENISSYAQLFVVFALTSGLFYINTFIFVPLWLIVVIEVVVSLLVVYQLIQANHINNINNWLFIVVVSLIMGEMIWVMSFLPTIYYVNGILITIIFYLLSGLGRQILMGTFRTKNLLRYLLIGGLGILIILFSSQWI
jgi:hypothetical protein